MLAVDPNLGQAALALKTRLRCPNCNLLSVQAADAEAAPGEADFLKSHPYFCFNQLSKLELNTHTDRIHFRSCVECSQDGEEAAEAAEKGLSLFNLILLPCVYQCIYCSLKQF